MKRCYVICAISFLGCLVVVAERKTSKNNFALQVARSARITLSRIALNFLPHIRYHITSLRGRKHIKLYNFYNSVTYGWKAGYYTSYESYVCALSSDVW